MATPLPFVVYSDGPGLPTGLARIARDLTARLHAEQDSLGIEVLQIGFDPKPRSSRDVPWPTYALAELHSEGDWGAGDLAECWAEFFYQARDEQAGVIFSIWDPSRAYSLLGLQSPDRALWGYFPIDGWNVRGSIGGPAREAVSRYDRCLAYGRWGSQVLATIRKPVSYLPHGLDLEVWHPGHNTEALERAVQVLRPREGYWTLGCVATNQPRKDLGLYFATLAELRSRGEKVRGWLHTDVLTRSWAVGQLVEDFGLGKAVSVSLSLPDEVLSACYSLCGATFAPGLGEGFGYPIVESLACGTPCVHGDYAGGRELVPLNAWRVPFVAERLEGLYGLRRPVMDPKDCANAILRAVGWKREEEGVCQRYCQGSISHLDWKVLWPRWRSWVKQGLDGLNG